MSGAAEPEPPDAYAPGTRFLPGTTSFHVGRLTLAAVLLAAYAIVLVAYWQSTLGAGVDARAEPPPGGVSLIFVPTSLDATAATMAGVMYVVPSDELVDDSGRLRVDLSVDVLPVLGAGTTTMTAGQPVTPLHLLVSMSGSVRNYPFDRYAADIISVVETRVGPDDLWQQVPVAVGASGEIGGWSLAFADPPAATFAGIDATVAEGYGIQSLAATRAVSTIALAILVLLLMVLLAVMTALVARAVAFRRRRVEPTLAGWMAAMLFALIPLRNFLPGAPPLGSWIDVLVFFWVEVIIMLALLVFIATWLRDGRASDHPPVRSSGSKSG